MCVCVCVCSLQYVIDTFLRLDDKCQDVLLTCYSLMFAIVPETLTLLNAYVCVCVLYWSKSQARCADTARVSNGYIKPPNEKSGHKQDKYRNHEHTHFGCTCTKQQPGSCTFIVPARPTCCVQISTR